MQPHNAVFVVTLVAPPIESSGRMAQALWMKHKWLEGVLLNDLIHASTHVVRRVESCKTKIGAFASVIADHVAEIPIDLRREDRDRPSHGKGGSTTRLYLLSSSLQPRSSEGPYVPQT